MPSTATAPILFPGHVITLDSEDEAEVLAIQHRLNEVGITVDETGEFDRTTAEAVKLFQARFTDPDGLPLEVDGVVGPLTWAALFGPESVPGLIKPSSPLLAAVLEFAATQIGVMEHPLGSNRGPEVDEYVRSVGLDPKGKFAWCVAFTFFCFEKAAGKLGRSNPMVRTAAVLVTIEGNTNESGAPEGTGVFRRTGRKIVSINKGFIDYNSL